MKYLSKECVDIDRHIDGHSQKGGPLKSHCLFSVICALIDVMCIFIYINIIQSINDINILLKK